MTLILRDPKCHCGHLVKVGAYRSQMIKGILPLVHPIVGPVDPLTHNVAVSPVSESILKVYSAPWFFDL